MGIMQNIYETSSALYFVPGSRNLNQPAFHGSTELAKTVPTGPRAMSQVATVPLPPPIESFVVPRLLEKNSRWWFQTFFNVHPENWGKFPIWLIFFQMGWNHQLENLSHFWSVFDSFNPMANPTVDGWSPANQLRLVVYPIIFRVLYTPRWCGISSISISGKDLGISDQGSPILLPIPESLEKREW